jgi:hypothetical protein
MPEHPDSPDPDVTTEEGCGRTYNTGPGGFSLIWGGRQLAGCSGVLLSVDEVRVGREKGQIGTVYFC